MNISNSSGPLDSNTTLFIYLWKHANRPHNSYTWVLNTDYRLTLPQIEVYTFNKHLPFIAEKNQLFTCYLIFFYKNDMNWYFINFWKLINGSTMMNLSVAFLWSDLRRYTATTVQHKLFQAIVHVGANIWCVKLIFC